MGVDKSTTTRLVRPLIDKKLLVKEKSTADSRAVELVLTSEGRRIRLKVRDCAADFFALARNQVGDERWARAVDGIGLFVEALNRALRLGQVLPTRVGHARNQKPNNRGNEMTNPEILSRSLSGPGRPGVAGDHGRSAGPAGSGLCQRRGGYAGRAGPPWSRPT